MSTSVEMPAIASRQEGDGYVVHVRGTSRYLYANTRAYEILDDLREGGEASLLEAREESGLVAEVLAVLCGERTSAGEPGDGTPYLCPLSEIVDAADRCETFGMPL